MKSVFLLTFISMFLIFAAANAAQKIKPATKHKVSAALPVVNSAAESTAIASQAQDLELLPGSRIRLDGDSTMHKFSATATEFVLKAKVLGNTPSEALSWSPKKLELKLPVTNLKSGDEGLDARMYAAMKTEKYSEITFSSDTFRMAGSQIEISGDLTIAGVTKNITVLANFKKQEDLATFTGQYELKMSDYGISPPTMMAFIKVADQIKINFEIKYKM